MNEENEKKEVSRLIFRPLSPLYFFMIFLWTFLLFPFLILTGNVFVRLLGIPPFITFIIFMLSLFGSYVNIMEVVSTEPIIALREVTFFGVRWTIPEFEVRRKRTIVALNVGGALVPLIVSIYLLVITVPSSEANLFVAYTKIFLALAIVTLIVHAVATPVKGLGIATPAFLPPFITALTSLMLYRLYVPTNPFIIAYVAGTLGTLLGADILNLDKVSRLGAPLVSIGGAGTFDGVYLTGLVATLLVLILI